MAAKNGGTDQDAQFLLKLKTALARLAEPDRDVLLTLAKRLAMR
jgi:hypothetical protein